MSSPYVPSSDLVPVTIYINISKPGEPSVLADVEVENLDKENLPEHVKVETSHWRRPNWAVATHITANSYKEDKEGRTHFDITRLALARIRCLLVDWTLKDGDPELALEKVESSEVPGMEVLSDTGIRTVGRVDQMVVDAFYIKAMESIYPNALDSAQQVEENIGTEN